MAQQPSDSQTSLDELEAKIEAAKREAARRSTPPPPAVQPAAQPPALPTGTMIIKASSDCDLTLNGQPSETLLASKTKAVKVNVGEHLIECTAADGRTVEVTRAIKANEQIVLKLEFASPTAPAAEVPEGALSLRPAAPIPNTEVFCQRLGEVVKTPKSRLKGKPSEYMSDSWEPRIQLPNADWCALNTLPGFGGRKPRIYYSCMLVNGLGDLNEVGSLHRDYAVTVQNCLGDGWLREDSPDDDDAKLPGETKFTHDEGASVQLRLSYDFKSNGKEGDMTIYVEDSD